MTTFPATEIDPDGQLQPILAIAPDIPGEIDGNEEDAIAAARREGGALMLEAILSAVVADLATTPKAHRSSAVAIRLLAFFVRLRRQPAGADSLASVADLLGLDKSAATRAAQKVSEKLPGGSQLLQ